MFHDQAKLLNLFPETKTVDPETDVEIESPIENSSLSIGFTSSQESIEIPQKFGDPSDIENEDDNSDDISDQYESSSCTVVKINTERHFREANVTILTKKSKLSYPCNWLSRGKIFKKKVNHQSHLSKHKGTPSLKSGKCRKLVCYRRGLHSHKSRNNCQPIQEPASTSSKVVCYSKPTSKLQRFAKHVVPNGK